MSPIYPDIPEGVMSDEDLFLDAQHPSSGRIAILDDDGTSAWLYLRKSRSDMPVADAWVYNRVPAPPITAIQSYRGRPPPVAQGYASDAAFCPEPGKHEWSFVWSSNGESVAVLKDGLPVACIVAGEKRGYSRDLVLEGGWGHPWSDQVFETNLGPDTGAQR